MTTISSKPDADSALIIARQSIYRFAAMTLLDPRVGSWEQLASMRTNPLIVEAAALVRSAASSVDIDLGPGECPLCDLDPAPILARLPASREIHNSIFENRFGLLIAGACPLYETEYIDSKFAFQRSNALADINGFYHAFGLAVSNAHAQRPDHIVLELEFMATLLRLERQANTAGKCSQDKRQVCRDAQQRFFQEHLAWWVPAFSKLLIHEDDNGWYAAVGIFLATLVTAERALLHVEIPRQLPSPISSERPEQDCQDCELSTHLN